MIAGGHQLGPGLSLPGQAAAPDPGGRPAPRHQQHEQPHHAHHLPRLQAQQWRQPCPCKDEMKIKVLLNHQWQFRLELFLTPLKTEQKA